MTLIDAMGLAAGALTTTSFVPQITRIVRTKSADDISTGMFLMFCTGVALWLAYGIARSDLAVIVANVVTLVLAGAVLVLKWVYRRK